MDNKLIAEIEVRSKREKILDNVIPEIKRLLNVDSSKFTKEESIVALEKIRDYFVSLDEEYKSHFTNIKSLYLTLYDTCKHEVLMRENNSNICKCAICGERLIIDDINFDCFLIDSIEGNHMNSWSLISYIIKEIASNDEDIMEVFEDKLYSKNDSLLVYRRSR